MSGAPTGPWLDEANERVWRDGAPRRLTPKAFAVLAYLCAHHGRLVTKDELLGAVWPGVVVGDAALTVVISELRRALGDDARAPRFIATVHRRGFRLIAPLALWQPGAGIPVQGWRFVGRTPELAQLERSLAEAAAGTRRVVVVSGEVGIGKTALVDAFAERVAGPRGARIARGHGVEHQGPSEPYLPVLEALGRLGRERRAALIRRETGAAAVRMLREGCEAIEALASRRALVLVLEDLHWSDPATIDLLARLAVRDEPARLLVIVTCRHPVPSAIRELIVRRRIVELELSLLSEGDVRAYLAGVDAPPGVARAVHQRTDGHPMFMVEVLDGLARQGWRTDADELPVPDSIRHLIAQKLDRQEPMAQQILEVASVTGEDFPAALVAGALDLPADEIDDACARLARLGVFLRMAGIGTYRFLHALDRQAVYEWLAPGRRARLHRRIGEVHERTDAVERAAEIARHFLASRDPARAVPHLRQAAAVATRRRGYRQAIVHLRSAVAALAELPQAPERSRQELDVHVALGTNLMLVKGYAAPEVERAFAVAETRCRELGNVAEPLAMLAGLWRYHQVAGNIASAYDRAEQLLDRGRRDGNPTLLLEAHRAMGMTLCVRGEPLSAHDHLEAGLRLYEPESHGVLAHETGWDAGVMCLRYGALALWTVGLPERARLQTLQAIEQARRSSHAPSLVAALVVGARMFQFRREPPLVRALAEEGLAVAREHGFALRAAAATMLLGWAQSAEGETVEGLATMRAGFAAYETTGAWDDRPYWLALLAETTARTGDHDTALRVVDEGIRLARGGLRAWEADLQRLRGALAPADAENALGMAVEIARSQAARTLELRAATSLARLWKRRGRARAARDLLSERYRGFTEGFDTPDLVEARTVLETLPH